MSNPELGPKCPHCGRPMTTVFEGFAPGSLHCMHCIRDEVDANRKKAMHVSVSAHSGSGKAKVGGVT